jgi:hypothetical protein
MIHQLPTMRKHQQREPGLSPCAHRTVSKDGRIICAKIVEGDNAVSLDVCRDCPVRAINCTHLSFSLRQTQPSRLIVRFNGRTEIWDDDPPEILFDTAACAAKVMPVDGPRSCAGCTLRMAIDSPTERPTPRQRRAAAVGKVVPFPRPSTVAAAG